MQDIDPIDALSVIGSERHTGLLDALFHTSIAKQLALHSNVPLLVLVE